MPICLDIRRVCHAHATGFHFVMPNFTLNTCFTHRKKIARENKNITTSTKTAGLYPQYFFYVIARKKVWKILVRNCVLRVKAGTPLIEGVGFIMERLQKTLTFSYYSLFPYRFSFSAWKNPQMAVAVKQLWLKTTNSSPNWTPKLCESLKRDKCDTSDTCQTNPIKSTWTGNTCITRTTER